MVVVVGHVGVGYRVHVHTSESDFIAELVLVAHLFYFLSVTRFILLNFLIRD